MARNPRTLYSGSNVEFGYFCSSIDLIVWFETCDFMAHRSHFVGQKQSHLLGQRTLFSETKDAMFWVRDYFLVVIFWKK